MNDDVRSAQSSAKTDGDIQNANPVCGVIMPISETATHTELHWQSIQTLLHRAIVTAGFTAKNVWEGTTDRISERIIANIFQMPIVLADITDLNPNVMLELGLRLASKRPTVVIATTASVIPFDIRDFHAVLYPADMNMLGMEDFFKRLGRVLQDKYRAMQSETYVSFLGNVIVDVASPETREVGVNDIILTRLDDISSRLRSVESMSKLVRNPVSNAVAHRSSKPLSGSVYVIVPEANVDDFTKVAMELFEVDIVQMKSSKSGMINLEVMWSGGDGHFAMDNKISEIAARFGGDTDLPF